MNGYQFGGMCLIAAAILWLAGAAKADPIPAARAPQVLDAQRINAPIDPYCFDQRLCSNDFGSTYYCPDTGGWVGPFGACDALVTGPYAPGGQRPNQSNWDDEGDDW